MMDGLLESCFTAVSLWAKKESLLRANWYPNKKTLGPRPPQFLLFVQGVCHLPFLFIFVNLKNNYQGSFFFKTPKAKDQHVAAFQEEEKKRNQTMFCICWVGSIPHTSYLEHDSNPIAITKPHPYYYYYSHTCSSNPTAGVKIFVFFNTKNSVFFFFFFCRGGILKSI